MANEHSTSQNRRPHFHRGRRGGDRRAAAERRSPPQPNEQGGRGQVDVEQIMREIRARIAKRHGIELTSQAGNEDLVKRFTRAREEEREHLEKVHGWYKAAVQAAA